MQGKSNVISIDEARQRREETVCHDEPVELPTRPRTRADCADVPRPCPWVACRHNAYLDLNPKSGGSGKLMLNFPGLEPDEVPPEKSCVLDMADRGPQTLEEVAELLNVTRERVRQIEVKAGDKLRRVLEKKPWLRPDPQRYHLPIYLPEDDVTIADEQAIQQAANRILPAHAQGHWNNRKTRRRLEQQTVEAKEEAPKPKSDTIPAPPPAHEEEGEEPVGFRDWLIAQAEDHERKAARLRELVAEMSEVA